MQNNWLIHYSADDYWNSNPHSRHHITEQLNKHYKVLWVNPMGSRVPSMKKKGFWGRVFRKLKSLLKLIKKVDDRFYVTTFISIPYFKEGKIQNFNRRLIRMQLRFICFILRIKRPLLLYTTPVYADTLGMIKHKFAVYYYSDQYTAYREFDSETREYTEKLDEKLYLGTDLIMCASQKIYDNVVEKTQKKVTYFPHQVDYSYFTESEQNNVPDDIKHIKKPIIGYYGTLSDSNDWEIIRYCAEQRPDYNFVFIGRKDIKETGLENFSNVHFLGKKPFSEIPVYGKQFTVGIMFWILREWIVNCSPLKLKEYLSLGLPVISTKIMEVERNYSDIVYVADDKEQFLEALDKAILEDNSDRINQGVEKVKSDSWYNAVKIIENEISEKS